MNDGQSSLIENGSNSLIESDGNPLLDEGYNFYDNAPGDYALCFKSECASADCCLRRLAARDIDGRSPRVTIVNPLLADAAGGAACRFFRNNGMIRVAFGFRQAMSKIESGKVAGVRIAIGSMMCRRNYFYMLKGERPIYPEMQEAIAKIMLRSGLTAPMVFDRYEWRYSW